MIAPTRTGCSFRSSGRVNSQEALHDLVEPAHLRRDDREVLLRGGLVGELHLQQLEVDHRRVERVLDLVRDAGREPAERGELARVAERRLDLAQVGEVARDEHDADQAVRRRPDDVR